MRGTTHRIVVAVLALLTLGGALAACGDDDSSAGPATVAVGDSELGRIVVDGEGRTLYVYTHLGSGSTSTPGGEETQESLPPLTIESEDDLVAGEGIDESKLDVARQEDGRLWVTYNGHLLYRSVDDDAPGDIAGQGAGGLVFVLDPEGNRISA